ncbi:MAG: TetR/AcrR family transcriptional regulator [Erysipelotrichaceae bacterium]|nr:TetR/AcrR family transcriptional regulator [Erysipelotrichaceae bacterium]
MYKTGVETKQHILDAARELFYENGFKNTSVFRICEKAETMPGTFTYHYPKKIDLLKDIYGDYMQRVIDFVDMKKHFEHPAERHLHVLAVYYTHLYIDPRIMSFHKEVLQIASMNFWFHNTRRLIAGYSGEGSLPSDDPHFGLYVKADNAVRRELNLNFIENSDHSLPAIKELLEEIYTINAKLFDVGLDLTEHYLAEAFAFAERCLEEDLSLLPAASD